MRHDHADNRIQRILMMMMMMIQIQSYNQYYINDDKLNNTQEIKTINYNFLIK